MTIVKENPEKVQESSSKAAFSKEELYEQIKELAFTKLTLEEEAKKVFCIDSHIINDLKTDSLDSVELVLALEEHYDIEIPDTSAAKLVFVRDVVDYVYERKSS